jgi:hypothetical protein
MVDKKTGVWLAAGAAGVLVVAAAAGVAVSGWGGSGRGPQVQAARAASDGPAATAPRRTSYRGSSNRFLIKFDTDNDGRITRAEVDAGIVAEFQSIDSSHDGRIDPAEYRVFDDGLRARRKAWRDTHPDADGAQDEERPRSYDPMKRLDWNLDGFVSLEEWGGRTRSIAMRADSDGDGTVLVADLTKPSTRRTAAR